MFPVFGVSIQFFEQIRACALCSSRSSFFYPIRIRVAFLGFLLDDLFFLMQVRNRIPLCQEAFPEVYEKVSREGRKGNWKPSTIGFEK